MLTAPHGVVLARPLVALHLGVAAFLLCRVVAAVVPVAAPGRHKRVEFGCPPAFHCGTDSRGALLTHSSWQQCSPGLSVNHLLMNQVSQHPWEGSRVSGAH